MKITVPFNRSLTFWPFMFLSSEQASDPAIIAHETIHYGRQAWWSPIWILIYLLFPSFRFSEEKLGYAAQIAYYKAHGWASGWNAGQLITDMSAEYGVLFGQMCTVAEATSFVNEEMSK